MSWHWLLLPILYSSYDMKLVEIICKCWKSGTFMNLHDLEIRKIYVVLSSGKIKTSKMHLYQYALDHSDIQLPFFNTLKNLIEQDLEDKPSAFEKFIAYYLSLSLQLRTYIYEIENDKINNNSAIQHILNKQHEQKKIITTTKKTTKKKTKKKRRRKRRRNIQYCKP